MTKGGRQIRGDAEARRARPEGSSGNAAPGPSQDALRTAARRAQAKRNQHQRGNGLMYIIVPALIVVVLGGGFLAYIAGQNGSGDSAAVQSTGSYAEQSTQDGALAGVVWPTYVSRGPTSVREAYQFAVLRPDVLQYMPCYCGCGQHNGHRSNKECFVANMNQGGQTIAFDSHGST